MFRSSVLGIKSKIFESLDNYAVPFSAGILLAMLLQTCFGLQTFSNLVTGVSSLATALIAYKALAVGRDYVGKMMTEEGYKKAIILKDEIMPKFFSENFSSFYLSSALGLIKVLTKQDKTESETQLCLKNLYQYSRVLYKHADSVNATCSQFHRLLASTKTHDLTLNSEYISDFFGTEDTASATASKIRNAASRIELIIQPFFKPMSNKDDLTNLNDNYKNIFWCNDDSDILLLEKEVKEAENSLQTLEDYMMKYERLKYKSIKDIFRIG